MKLENHESVKMCEYDDDKYEYVPPEGGWGYLICVGLSLIFIAGTAHQPVFGFIYNEFLDDLGVGTGAVTVVYGVFQVTLAIAGFSTNIALKRLSLRQVGLIGAFIYTLASFLAIFVVSTTQLIITNGFLQGLGMGVLIPVAYTSFNSYFTKKKVLYLSLCKASIGLITMLYPLFIKFTMSRYGFRGTLAILCGISAHSIFGAMVMHPVKWHMIKQPKPVEKIVLIPPTPATEDMKETFDFTKNGIGINKAGNARSVENLCSSARTENRKGSELLLAPKLDSRRLSIPVVLIPADSSDSRFNSTDAVYIENLYKAASVSSLGNFGSIAAEPMPIIKNKEGKWQTVAEYLDLTLLKDWVYDNIIFGMSLAFFADLTFFTLEPLFLDRNHLSRTEIANIIAIGGATDMCARLLLGVSGQFFRMNSRHMFFTGALLTAVFRIVFVEFTTYTPLLILTGILGGLRSLVHIAQPIVMAEHVPIERYPPAYGLYMLLAGGISLSVGPMIENIRCEPLDVLSSLVFASDRAVQRTKVLKQMERKEMNKAPEGGWGYVVCFGVIITFISGIGHINSFGLIYNDFMIETKSTAKSLTTAHGVFGMMLAIGGLILNVISKKYPLRIGGLIGAMLFCIGSFATIFITSTNQLPFTFGVLQGIGFGIMVPVSYSTLNHYFVRKRTTVMSACKAIQGITLMWYPQLFKKMITHYGFRGTLFVLSAISFHTFPGMAVMKTSFKKSRKLNSTNQIERGIDRKVEENVDLLNHDDNVQTNKNVMSTNEKTKARLWLKEILTLVVLTDPVYLNICFGQSFVNFSDLTFFVLQPMLLFQYGYDRTQVATCISIGAAADVAGRCALTIISSFASINTRLLFYTATVLTLVLRIVLLQVQQLVWIATVTAALGVLRAWLHVASPLVISSYVSHEDFPGAYSIFMLVTGLVNMTFSPIVGFLKDEYQDYTPAFYALSICCLPCIIFWPIEYILKRKSL